MAKINTASWERKIDGDGKAEQTTEKGQPSLHATANGAKNEESLGLITKMEEEEASQIVLWEKSCEHNKITEQLISKKTIYAEKQNYPELVVEDIINDLIPCINADYIDDMRNHLYAILLKRGINKWLFVRKLVIRLKKKYQYKIRELQELQTDSNLTQKEYWKLKGELKAYCEIRKELQLLANTPRWIIWNWKKVGLIDFTGTAKGKAKKWRKLFDELTNMKFNK